MIRSLVLLLWLLLAVVSLRAQDTFSIVAVDSVTGEVGSAGASCVDLGLFFPTYATDFLGDLIPGQGAINTQASYSTVNQANARARMLLGETPQQIISWLTANDANNNPNSRQYGIAALVNGSPQTAGFTGTGTLNYKNHVTGPNYSIQGNILLGQAILDSMEARFLNTPGSLACKLMAALQGAKVPGADTRCANNGAGTSSLFAFLKVSQPTDPYGSPSLLVSVKTPGGFGIEPIDSLQILFNAQQSCNPTAVPETIDQLWNVYPNPAGDFLYIEPLIAESSFNETLYQLLTAEGKKVIGGRLKSGINSIDMSRIAKGIYLLELETERGTVTRKVVRK
jgi:uncharacterized Ntn-hydrolase superfamily protein